MSTETRLLDRTEFDRLITRRINTWEACLSYGIQPGDLLGICKREGVGATGLLEILSRDANSSGEEEPR